MWAQEVSIIPQLDGPGSLPMRDPIGRQMHRVSRPVEQDSSQRDTYVPRASATRRREYPGEDSDNDGSRRTHRDWRPPDRGRYPNLGVTPLTKEDTLMEDPQVMEDHLEEDILIGIGDPLEEEDTLAEDLLVMEDPWTSWWTRTTRPSGTTWTSKTHNSTNPQVTLDMSALENTFDAVRQSMLQLARAQDQTNRQLQ